MNFNLAVILTETAAASPGKPVAVYDGGQMTYGELDAMSDRLAVGLELAGLRPGDVVGLQLPNIAQFLIAYFGILKAGAVVMPLNVLLKAPEAGYQLQDSGARVLITWEGILGEAAKGAEVAGLTQIYAVGHAGGSAGACSFEELLAAPGNGHQLARRELTDTAAIVYTSGTTGRPKGAELTHIQLYMNADIPGRLFDVRADDVVITVLPLFHVFGMSSILDVCVRFGCTMSLVPRFDPAAVLTAIQRDRATIFEGVPTMFASLLACPAGTADRGPGLPHQAACEHRGLPVLDPGGGQAPEQGRGERGRQETGAGGGQAPRCHPVWDSGQFRLSRQYRCPALWHCPGRLRQPGGDGRPAGADGHRRPRPGEDNGRPAPGYRDCHRTGDPSRSRWHPPHDDLRQRHASGGARLAA